MVKMKREVLTPSKNPMVMSYLKESTEKHSFKESNSTLQYPKTVQPVQTFSTEPKTPLWNRLLLTVFLSLYTKTHDAFIKAGLWLGQKGNLYGQILLQQNNSESFSDPYAIPVLVKITQRHSNRLE